MSKQTKSMVQSDYMRLIRFFKMNRIKKFIRGIQKLLVSIIELESNVFIMDRTNWKIGGKSVNLLTIGVLQAEVFLPINWLQLNREGNSGFGDRKKVLDLFLALLRWAGKRTKGMVLLCDREFGSHQWLEHLAGCGLSFVIRLKSNLYAELSTVAGKKNFAPKSV